MDAIDQQLLVDALAYALEAHGDQTRKGKPVPYVSHLLRVAGISMQGAGILDGDLLAVHRVPEAHNGQIVVARMDDEVTVKRFRRRGHHVQLVPENDDFEPIEIDLRRQNLAIEGLGVGVIRPQLNQGLP